MTEESLKQQKLNSDETIITQPSVSDSHLAELQEKIQQTEATNKVWPPLCPLEITGCPLDESVHFSL